MLEAVETCLRYDASATSVDTGAALAMCQADGVRPSVARFLIAEAAGGMMSGQAKRQAKGDMESE